MMRWEDGRDQRGGECPRLTSGTADVRDWRCDAREKQEKSTSGTVVSSVRRRCQQKVEVCETGEDETRCEGVSMIVQGC